MIQKYRLNILDSESEKWFIWNINKNQSISYKEKVESVLENLNEKIFILMILLNNNYLSEFSEEIDVKLSDENLKNEMKEILRAYTEKNSFMLLVDSYKEKSNSISKCKNFRRLTTI